MRSLVLLLAACATQTDPPAAPADEAPANEAPTTSCPLGYVVPGPLGTVSAAPIDPHADVFGAPETIPGLPSSTVGPDPAYVHLGLPNANAATSVSFVWSTDSATPASRAECRPEGGEVTQSKGVSYSFGGPDQNDYRVHELKLCDELTPGTTYTYRVGGEGHWSRWFTFSTPGAPGTTDNLVIAVAGDSRGAYEDWARTVDAMAAHDPDLYLFTGDMVQFGTNQSEWHAWWTASGDRFAERLLLPAHGNHEFLSSNYFALFSMPDNEQWYTADFGPLTLASLNDTVSDAADVETVQAQFLRERLGPSTATWRFAMHHQSPYAVCDTHGSNLKLRETWSPIYDDLGVDLVLAGHNHIYERSVPIRADADAADGTTYLVTGGAGAPIYDGVEPEWFNVVANPVAHYVIGELTATEAVFTVRDLAGNVLDTFTLPVSP